ncbi:hypothetical protein NDU88_004891 [Pleurodeles waltl]|uniref:Uncharacterized protein n=1 Tax=Pleurodeles waltl TaxID=8319 RepID=A0AAV7V4V4_PLEWA|nr:hypothetical protein NDU88_004891 [Pleurodeles waltl]
MHNQREEQERSRREKKTQNRREEQEWSRREKETRDRREEYEQSRREKETWNRREEKERSQRKEEEIQLTRGASTEIPRHPRRPTRDATGGAWLAQVRSCLWGKFITRWNRSGSERGTQGRDQEEGLGERKFVSACTYPLIHVITIL